MTGYRKFWLSLLALALVTPLGLYLPSLFGSRSAWGEWSLEEIRHMLGYVPTEMERLANLWHAPLQKYAFPGQGDAPLGRLSLAYIVSALLGIGVSAGGAYLLARWLTRRSR